MATRVFFQNSIVWQSFDDKADAVSYAESTGLPFNEDFDGDIVIDDEDRAEPVRDCYD